MFAAPSEFQRIPFLLYLTKDGTLIGPACSPGQGQIGSTALDASVRAELFISNRFTTRCVAQLSGLSQWRGSALIIDMRCVWTRQATVELADGYQRGGGSGGATALT
jgi:hypothetical protein